MYCGAGDGLALGVDLVLDHHGEPRAQPSEASSGEFRAPAVIREARDQMVPPLAFTLCWTTLHGPALGVDLVLDHHGQPRAQPSRHPLADFAHLQ